MTRTEELLALADKATPGPWETDIKDHDCPHQDIRIRHNKGNIKRTICTVWIDDACYDENPQQERNAHFIAACDPETIKQLCLRLQKLEALVRLQNAALIELSPCMHKECCQLQNQTQDHAIAAFNKFEGGE